MATQAATGRPHLRLLSGECGSVDVQARLAQAINTTAGEDEAAREWRTIADALEEGCDDGE